jgi:hypothetical protein
MVEQQVGRDLKKQKEAMDGIDFIAELFDVPRFPRTIATGATSRGQRTVHSRDEVLTYFQASLYQDCYMNAYPNYDEMAANGELPQGFKPVPNHIIIDLDREDFNSDEELEAALATTLQNINKENFTGIIADHSIVVWSGNGYHVHIPLPGFKTPLEDMPEFGAWKDDKELSNKFLRWAERTLSNGKADQHHNPSIKSALFRIPGTFNSKAKTAGRDPRVRLVQGMEYILHRITEEQSLTGLLYDEIASKPTQKFLNNFQGYLIQELIDDKVEKLQRRKYSGLIRVGNNCNNNAIDWIDQLLSTGVADGRKNLIYWVLSPYLINIKNMDYDQAYHIIEAWLEHCDQIRSLEPGWKEFRYRIRYCLDSAEDQERKPIRFETFKEYYPDLYKRISIRDM